jgi:hypothetical protein
MESGKTTSKSFTGFHHGQSRRAEPCQGRRGESVGTLAPPQGCRQRPRRCRTASTAALRPNEKAERAPTKWRTRRQRAPPPRLP